MSIVHLQGKKTIMDIAAQIGQMERQFGIDTSVEDYMKELNFGLVEVVYEWANEMVRICRCMTHSMRLLSIIGHAIQWSYAEGSGSCLYHAALYS